MQYLNKSILAIILSLLSVVSLDAQIQQEKSIDSIFAKWNNTTSPGCGLGIIKDGKLILAKGYGMANLEHNIPNSASSVFRIGSTSKQFTAACITLLEQQGKLKFSQTLDEFFPEFPAYAKKITVRHLLNHTSGVRDYLTLTYLKSMGDNDYYEDKDIMDWLTSQEQLNFEPGDEFLYSNSGYWLLGQIVNKVSGMNMSAYAKKEIFDPLGMTQTQFYTDHTQIVKNRAAGYAPKRKGGFRIDMTTLGMIGDGGILTSINDIMRWDDAFYNSKVLNKDFWKKMTTKGKLNNGKEIRYAKGLMIGKRKGLNVIKHGGSFVGFRAELIRFPEQHFTVAIFANRADANPTRMANKIADIFLSNHYKKESIPKKKAKKKSKQAIKKIALEQIEGEYELQPNVVFEIKKVDDSLQVRQKWNGAKYFIKRTTGNSFEIPGQAGVTFSFSDLKKGGTQKAIVSQRGSEEVCKRVEPVDLSELNLKDYVGAYYSKELDITYTFILKEDQLYIQVKSDDPEPIQAIKKDQFIIGGLIFNFEREAGNVSKFMLEAGRVKDLKFIKK